MKKVTTTLNRTGFAPTPNGFGVEKYKNVKLIPVSDCNYQAYIAKLIEKSKAGRPIKTTPTKTSAICRASRIVETIVRYWFGSHKNRILQYDVLYKGKYHRHYRECDIIRFENDGSVTIGEIKSSNKPSRNAPVGQLNVNATILSVIYNVNKIGLTVDMTETKALNEYIELIKVKQNKPDTSYSCISLSLGDAIHFAEISGYIFDLELIADANQEAIACAKCKSEKRNSVQNSIPVNSNPKTSFGMILQSALNEKYNLKTIYTAS